MAKLNNLNDGLKIQGRFVFECRDKNGRIKWRKESNNLMPTVGKNLNLDTFWAGSGYSVVGPYMGLISSVSYGAGPTVGDTMSSHSGWIEAGNANAPTYSGSRKTCVWSAASGGSKSLSAGLVFTFTGAGTVKGGFIILGSGASATVDNTGGVLAAALVFTGGNRLVGIGDTITADYISTLTS